MIDIIGTMGLTGSVASVIGLVIPARGWKTRILHAIYGLFIALLAGTAVYYRSDIARRDATERAAMTIVDKRVSNYTNAGFIHASLAFLEKNRDLFPDSYRRAVEICTRNDCVGTTSYSGAPSDVVFALDGLLQGIAAVSSKGAPNSRNDTEFFWLQLIAVILTAAAAVLMLFGSTETPWRLRTWDGVSPDETKYARRRRVLLTGGLAMLAISTLLQIAMLVVP